MTSKPRGSVARIGFLCPVDGLNDDEYWNYLAEGVGWYIARYSAGLPEETLDDEAIAAYADPALVARATDLLLAVKPDVVAMGDFAAGIFNGLEGDKEMSDAVGRVCGVPVATGLQAMLAAMTALKARRVSVVSPYPNALSARVEACFEAVGLDVLAMHSADESDEFGIGLSTEKRWMNAALAADHPDSDAIVIAGGGVRIATSIAATEASLGKPVIATSAALVWQAQRLAGIDATSAHLGSLYDAHGNA